MDQDNPWVDEEVESAPRPLIKLEAQRRSIQTAWAEEAFLLALQLALPHSAFRELSKLKPKDVRVWATSWSVAAPCVLRIAKAYWCDGQWLPNCLTQFNLVPTPPKRWLSEVARMNALPPWARPSDPCEWIQSDKQCREMLEQTSRLYPDCNQWGYRERNADARRKALMQNYVLAPIAADPLRESREDFLRRAGQHFDGRTFQGISLGYTHVSKRPELDLHIRWLVRYQIGGERFVEIASSPTQTSPAAVRLATGRLAKILRLPLRAARAPNRRSPNT